VSLLEQSPLGLNQSLLEPTAIEQSLERIRSVEATWRLPELPDEVKLDLATNAGTNVGQFLFQLDADLGGDDREEAAPVQTGPAQTRSGIYLPQASSFSESVGIAWNDLLGEPAKMSSDVSAPQKLKGEMVRRGILPEGTALDSSWSAELQSLKYDLNQEIYQERLGGQKFGSVSVGSATKFIDDWLSPTGLWQAAIDLDLMWDPKAIANETATWGDKWRKLGKSKDVFDFGANLVDALTGPLDDIALPAVNWALVFMGVGGAYQSIKAIPAAMKGAQAVDGLYAVQRSSGLFRAFRAADAVEDATRLGAPSWMSQRLSNSSYQLAARSGERMAAWRQLAGVRKTKKVVQTGMRLGVVSRAEDLIPGYQGGFSLADTPVGQAGQDQLQGLRENVWGQGLVEAVLTPYAVFEPGTITGALKAGGRGAQAVLSSASAVPGAAGKIPLVRATKAGKKLQQFHFSRVADNQNVAIGFHQGVLKHLSHDPAAIERYQNLVNEGTVKEALKTQFNIGTDEELGAMMTFTTVAAAVDHAASAAASVAGAERNAGWWRRYFQSRNGFIGQLRGLDPDDPNDTIMRLAELDGGSRDTLLERVDKLNGTFSSDADGATKLKSLAQVDNDVARRTLTELLDSMTPQVLDGYLPQVLDKFSGASWQNFVKASGELRSLQADGVLAPARLQAALGPRGGRLNVTPEMSGPMSPPAGAALGNEDFFVPLGESLRKRVGDPDFNWVEYTTKSYANPLTKHVHKGTGKVTVANSDTVLKQELLEMGSVLQDLLKTHDIVRSVKVNPKLGKLVEELGRLGDVAEWDMRTVANLAGAGKSGEKARRLVGFMRRYRVNADQLQAGLDEALATLNSADDWTRRYQMPSIVREGEGVLPPVEALRRRRRQLYVKAKHTATEIDVDRLIEDTTDVAAKERLLEMKGELDRSGYRVVYGQEFMTPGDLLETRMFADVSARQMRGANFAKFFQRRAPEVMQAMQNRYLRESIGRSIQGAIRRGDTDLGALAQLKIVKNGVVDMESPDFDVLLKDLNEVLTESADAAWRAVQTAGESGSFVQKKGAALQFDRSPKSIDDLGLGTSRKRIISKLSPLYGDAGAKLIWQAIKQSRSRKFQEMGLYSLETKLRSANMAQSGLKLLSSGIVGGAVGAYAAGQAYEGSDPGIRAALGLGGAAAGVLGAKTLGKSAVRALDPAADALGRGRLARYMYLPDELADMRDFLRFSLNPFLDLSRYTEGYVMGVTSKLPKLADGSSPLLPLSDSPRRFKRLLVEERVAQGADVGTARAGADQALKDWETKFRKKLPYDADALGELQRWAFDVGLMGYIPQERMAVRYAQALHLGYSEDQAYDLARRIHTYGTEARSAAEMSVNFLIFPFSFQKKALGNLGRFLTDDMSRMAIVNDSLKMYDVLNEKYNLSDEFKKRIPVLEMAGKFNLLQYGLSAGRVGGVNRPLLDVVANAFMPMAFNAKTGEEGKEVKRFLRSMLPIWNDSERMLKATMEQGHVIMSPHHQTKRADVEQGYNAWNEARAQANDLLLSSGWTWRDMQNASVEQNPQLMEMRNRLEQHRIDLEGQYPGWADRRVITTANSAARSMEKRDRIQEGLLFGQNWDGRSEPSEDFLLAKFEQAYEMLDQVLQKQGMSIGDEMVPPEWAEKMRALAIEYSNQNPRFKRLYQEMYERYLGPIEAYQGVGA